MVIFFVLIFSSMASFCSLPPDYPMKHILSDAVHHAHWQATLNVLQRRPSSEQSSQTVQQGLPTEQNVPALVLPNGAFVSPGSSVGANNGSAGSSASMVIRVPTYNSLSGPSTPTSPYGKEINSEK